MWWRCLVVRVGATGLVAGRGFVFASTQFLIIDFAFDFEHSVRVCLERLISCRGAVCFGVLLSCSFLVVPSSLLPAFVSVS